MDSKKISFGFNKLSKKPNIISAKAPIESKKVELIDCLEGQSIKVKDAVEEVYKPLIIPIKDNKKNLLDRIREARSRQTVLKDEPEDTRPDSELTPEELAARELIKDAKNRLENGTADGCNVSVLPLKSENITLEGEKEPTLEDYESIPVADYGLALLRGMGWKDGMPIGKNVSKTAAVSVPELRPKGLGLGATKIVQSEKPKENAKDKAGNELTLVKNSYARIIVGGEKGNYCIVQGFDEDAGRVIVKVNPKGNILNINEFMLVPVEKDEFLRGSKVLNNAKYEEYKEKSDKKLQKHRENFVVKMDSSSNYENKHNLVKNRKKDSSESEKEMSQKNSKIKHEERSPSRSRSSSKIKHNRYRDSESSDSDHYRKEKKSHKKSKSKSRNRSHSRDRYKKHKKQKSKSRSDSKCNDSDSDCRGSKKHHKYRSRHKSSSDEDSRTHRRK